MKRVSIVILITVFCFSISHSQEPEVLQNISGLELDGSILFKIERKDQTTLTLDYGEIDSTCVEKKVENGILKITVKGGFKCRETITGVLTVPKLKSISVSGKADVTASNLLTGDSLKLDVSGNAKAYLDMDIKHLEASLSGGGIFRSEGYANTQIVNTSTTSTYSGSMLEGKTVIVDATSNSIVRVFATESLIVEAGAGAFVGYKGTPKTKKLDPGANGKIEKLKEE